MNLIQQKQLRCKSFAILLQISMNLKYPEIVQFFRDSQNPGKLQQAANEYQTFAKTYHQIQWVLNFDRRYIESEIFGKLDEKELVILPRLNDQIIE